MSFTSDIGDDTVKALLSAHVALMMLEHEDTNSFSTKIYSVGNSEQAVRRKINALRERVNVIENGDGGAAVDADGDWTVLFGIQAKENTIDNIDEDFQGQNA
jgi:hypothetical protein